MSTGGRARRNPPHGLHLPTASHALRQSKYPCIPHAFAVHHPALFGQTLAKLHNAPDYANKHNGFAFRFAPFVRIICTMQNGTCFAVGHSPESSLSVRLSKS
jgi:hypothetical protein